MKICFPARNKNGENYATLDEMMELIGREKQTSWLAGTNRMWYGGIQLIETSAPLDRCLKPKRWTLSLRYSVWLTKKWWPGT